MGQVSIPNQFDFATMPDKETAQKIRPLIDYVNTLSDQVTRNINGDLTLGTNVKGQLRVVRMKHNEEVRLDFLGRPKTTKVLIIDVSDFDAITALRRKIDSRNQLVLKATFADATTDFRDVTLFLIP